MVNAKKETIDKALEFINHIYDTRSDAQYSGDYSITITAEGKSMTFVLNGIDADCISDEEMLIHMNVVNQIEE